MTYLKWENLLSDKRLRPSGFASNERNAFESDYGRVIFSPAIRRMHDKTQVFPLSDDDNIHTRLTHSQEVMSIGYTFGIKLVNEIFNPNNTDITENDFKFLKQKDECLSSTLIRTIPVILQTVCLFHDIGNTPFGHFGEDTISNYFNSYFKDIKTKLTNEQKNDFTEYDGNAQGLRVITKLQILKDNFGLNLTSAVLGTYLKYPNINKKTEDQGISNKKHGVFYSEFGHFNSIIQNCGLKIKNKIVRHPLCFLMEAADSIAYRTMDVEDGFNKKLYNTSIIIDEVLSNITDKKTELYIELDKLRLNSESEKSKMVTLRIKLIDYLVKEAFSIFKDNYSNIMTGNFQEELLDQEPFKVEKSLKNICRKYIYNSDEVNSMEITGNSVLVGLLDFYIKSLIINKTKLSEKFYNTISKSIVASAIVDSNKVLLSQKNIDISLFNFDTFDKVDEYYKLRCIVDYISGMTDKYALKQYQLISGHKLK